MSNNSSNTYIIKNKSIASFNEDYKLIIRGVDIYGKDKKEDNRSGGDHLAL